LVMLLGASVTALARRRPRLTVPVTVLCLVMVGAANPALFNGSTVLLRYTMRSPLPGYTTQAAAALNATHPGTRVLAVPGENTAAYTWGDTTDPVWPGLLTRPFVNREQFPLGSLPTYDMLYAFDNPMQNGTLDPKAIAPVARLLGAWDLLVQNDLNYSLFGQPQPQVFWQAFKPTPKGLGAPTGFGKLVKGVPSLARPKALEVFPVGSPRPIVRAESATNPLVVDGDAVGLDAVAGIGLLDTTAPILYAGSAESAGALHAAASAPGSTLLVTDSNRRQTFLWSRIQGNAGRTLAARDPAPKAPLDIFGHSPAAGQTTARLAGVAEVTGVPNGLQSSPAMALDGIPQTAWRTQASTMPQGRWWQVRLTDKVTTGHITLSQATSRDYEVYQWITKVGLSFDGGPEIVRTLGPQSRTPSGQQLTFPTRRFRTLRITVERTNLTGAPQSRIAASSSVGLSEVAVPGVQAQQLTVMPSRLLSSAGASSQDHRLILAMTRDRTTQAVPEADPEPILARSFHLTAPRTFTLSGTARIDSSISEQSVDNLAGRITAGGQVVSAYSSQRQSNSLRDSASATLDGSASTSWSPGLGTSSQRGSWLQVNLSAQKTLDHLDMTVVA
ncbi:MAG: alpha-(1-_3)-arabinofuranosyltransferase domain-containing protein, partial [Gemmatimonadales bacterium]